MDEMIVVAEHRKGELRDITFEMLTLAQSGTEKLLAGVTSADEVLREVLL